MKFGQLIEHNARNILFKNDTENEAGRLDLDFFVFLKSFLRYKQVVSILLSYFGSPWRGHAIKTNYITFQTVDPDIFSIWQFDFLEKGLGLVSPLHFVYDFLRKIFIIRYILLNDETLLSSCLYFLRYWAICVM